MSRLDSILSGTAELRAGALADLGGHVLESAGDADFETACATLALCRAQLESAVDMLGLGALETVSFMHGDQAVVTAFHDAGVDVYLGAAMKSPDSVAQRVRAARP